MFGLSYKTDRKEVKIHHGSCRFTINQSQSGNTKWLNYDELGDTVKRANSLAGRNQWRYAQCCLRRARYIYECGNCSHLTRGKRFVNKTAIGLAAFFTFGLAIIYGMLFQIIGPNYDPLFYEFLLYIPGLFFLGIIIVPIVYLAHPKRCSHCKTKKFY